MLSSNIPAKFPMPWGNSAGSSYIRPIPTGSQIGVQDGAASLTDGFPPKSLTPIIAGGVPPFGQDANGILKQITQWNQWQQAGGAIPYDSVFQSNIGGYPLGSIVSSATQLGVLWQNTVEANITNPDAGGAGWSTFSILSFDTYAKAQAANIPAGNNFLVLKGYYAYGDLGAATYIRTTGAVFSLTTADGAHWTLNPTTMVLPQMFGAVGDGVANDVNAIQAAINFLYNTNGAGVIGGGVVYFTPNTFKSVGGLVVKGTVRLVGASRERTIINGSTVDSDCVTFDTTCNYASAENLTIFGFLNAAAGSNACVVSNGAPVNLYDCTIWGGSSGLFNKGVDGTIFNSYIAGYTNNITSNGANWYVRCKIDDAALGTPTNGFLQGNYYTTGTAENHFVHCDISGNYTNSVKIDDAGTQSAITTFEGCVFSKPILISNAKISMFAACEFGSLTFTVGANPTLITGCANVGGGTITVSGAGKTVTGCYNMA